MRTAPTYRPFQRPSAIRHPRRVRQTLVHRMLVEALEDRRLLTSITHDRTTGVLLIDARDNAGDAITIDVDRSDVITATVGRATATVPLAAVSGIEVIGSVGPDTVTVADPRAKGADSIASMRIDTGQGHDTVTIVGALALSTTVNLANGDDTLDGSGALTSMIIAGGSGYDSLIGGEAADVLDVGADGGQVIPGAGNDTVPALFGTNYLPADDEVLYIFAVQNAEDTGSGSLRQAIVAANAAAGTAVIDFRIPVGPDGTAVIRPKSALPTLSNPNHPIIVNGHTQAAFGGDTNPLGPEVVLDGSLAGRGVSGITSNTDHHEIHRLNIQQFDRHGIWVSRGVGVTIADNYVGTDATGKNARGNLGEGILVNGTVSGFSITNNVVSANGARGLYIRGSRHIIQGNRVGTTADGSAALGNELIGIYLLTLSDSVVGGTEPGQGNLVSGNLGSGIHLEDTTTGNTIVGNWVGLDASGTGALGNGEWGIRLNRNVFENAIRSNIIVGHVGGHAGIGLVTGPGYSIENNVIAGNWVGLVPVERGVPRVFANSYGIVAGANSHNNTIGGSAPSDANVVGGGTAAVRLLDGTSENLVQGNYLGTDPAGHAGLQSGLGVSIILGASNNVVRDNVIGHNSIGIQISGSQTQSSDSNRLLGNWIGLTPDGTRISSLRDGVRLSDYSQRTVVGGTGVGEGNVIAHNLGAGVVVEGFQSSSHTIRGNSIYDNRDLEIDLGDDGVSPPDADDSDTGPNQMHNFGVLTDVQSGANTTVTGTYSGAPSAPLTFDFYANDVGDPTGFGGGQRYLGSTTVVTNSQGFATFEVLLFSATTPTDIITMTSTSSDGSTSEFSRGLSQLASNAAQEVNTGFAAIRNLVGDLATHVGVSSLPIVGLTDQLDALATLQDSGDQLIARFLGDLQGGLTSIADITGSLESIGFRTLCEPDRLSCAGGDIFRMELDVSPADSITSHAQYNLDLTSIGAADQLGVSGTITADLSTMVSLEFGLDQSGFFVNADGSIAAQVLGHALGTGVFGPFSVSATGDLELTPRLSWNNLDANGDGKLRTSELSAANILGVSDISLDTVQSTL